MQHPRTQRTKSRGSSIDLKRRKTSTSKLVVPAICFPTARISIRAGLLYGITVQIVRKLDRYGVSLPYFHQSLVLFSQGPEHSMRQNQLLDVRFRGNLSNY